MLGELFDPKSEFHIHRHCRPHWSQAGAVVFLTFRTADSIPREVVNRWEHDKRKWFRNRGKSYSAEPSRVLTPDELAEFQRAFIRTREAYLDTCHGRCMLKRADLGKIVADALLFFDGQRYRLGDFVVMPNHVHLLAAFGSHDAMSQQCDSWLHYTAVQINKTIGTRGKFWQQEPFDHLVRNIEQYEYLRRYIADNPRKAGLKNGEYIYRRYND